MKIKIEKSYRDYLSQFIIRKGSAYIGKMWQSKEKFNYQIGYSWGKLPTIFLNFKKSKPKIQNLDLFRILFPIPYIIFLIIKLTQGVLLTIWGMTNYCLWGYFKGGIKDWGWSDNFFLAPILVWKITAIIFIILYIIK
jgi:hypothetical protein